MTSVLVADSKSQFVSPHIEVSSWNSWPTIKGFVNDRKRVQRFSKDRFLQILAIVWISPGHYDASPKSRRLRIAHLYTSLHDVAVPRVFPPLRPKTAKFAHLEKLDRAQGQFVN